MGNTVNCSECRYFQKEFIKWCHQQWYSEKDQKWHNFSCDYHCQQFRKMSLSIYKEKLSLSQRVCIVVTFVCFLLIFSQDIGFGFASSLIWALMINVINFYNECKGEEEDRKNFEAPSYFHTCEHCRPGLINITSTLVTTD